ncbi:hypothetical protein [Mesorhizobium sp. Z1-4]|uniref:hypothetical protein n=1 Tax=Mesorhizobium sp. Z1-4 TaxID=2448478 RepID=UPI000FD94140|nr:hypothetical protein [Mesorhizobium sp. Z1-4]
MDVISTAKSPACARCGNPIGTSSIIEGDRYWHPECHSSFSDSASRAFYAAPTMRKEEQPIVERHTLRSANEHRQSEWDTDNAISLSYRGNELAGEVGEACNIIKKLDRERLGIRGSRASKAQLAEELADVVICADLIAMHEDIDLLGEAVPAKFNATSEKVGLATRLVPASTIEAQQAEIERLRSELSKFADFYDEQDKKAAGEDEQLRRENERLTRLLDQATEKLAEYNQLRDTTESEASALRKRVEELESEIHDVHENSERAFKGLTALNAAAYILGRVQRLARIAGEGTE